MKRCVIIGATSFVGIRLFDALLDAGWEIHRISRKKQEGFQLADDFLNKNIYQSFDVLFFLAPIWVFSQFTSFVEKINCKHIVTLSSTSRYSKIDSHADAERALAERLVRGEQIAGEWAQKTDNNLVIFQPTMIYGFGRDQNISEIGRFIDTYGFFPVIGQAKGLRQPLHVDDVVQACLLVESSDLQGQHAFIISGAEILTYREMVERIFHYHKRKVRFLSCPLWLFSCMVFFFRYLLKREVSSLGILERMNHHQNYDFHEAQEVLGFKPRSFILE